jgi:hypothetical protein
MESPLDDFPSEPTSSPIGPTSQASRVPHYAPIVGATPRRRHSRRHRRSGVAVLADSLRPLHEASVRAYCASVDATKQLGHVVRRAPLALSRSWDSVAAWVESHSRRAVAPTSFTDEIMHIAQDAGLTPVAAASLQRAVTESVKREAARLTIHDHDATPPRMVAVAVVAALLAGVVYGLMWQRSWIAGRVAPVSISSMVAAAPPPVLEAPVASLTPVSTGISEVAEAEHPLPELAAPVTARFGRPGQLRIVTEPPGARVTVNGVGRGVTPLTIQHLPPGAKRVRVTKDGYAGVERVISFAAGDPGRIVRIPLERRD